MKKNTHNSSTTATTCKFQNIFLLRFLCNATRVVNRLLFKTIEVLTVFKTDKKHCEKSMFLTGDLLQKNKLYSFIEF